MLARFPPSLHLGPFYNASGNGSLPLPPAPKACAAETRFVLPASPRTNRRGASREEEVKKGILLER